ncbi:MAG: hypothetical protein HY208_04550 [Nitrospirae bacterium]|nr:hypothetical protein [Nitrospirota bacterium]
MLGKTVEDFEDYLLERSPRFLKALEATWQEYQEKGGISPEKYLAARKKRAKF